MPNTLASILREHKSAIAASLSEMYAEPNANLTDDQRQAMALARVDGLIGMLQQSPDILVQTLQELTQSQASDIEDLDGIIDDIEREHRAAAESVHAAFPDGTEALRAMGELDRLSMARMRALVADLRRRTSQQLEASIADKQALRMAVQELSTPIIPVYSGILVLPLVGRIDDARAQDITESLLEAIAREQADMVLLDVTGILTMDTSVANHLMQSARAAALLGSQVILVGMSAEIAQTLVHMNVDLGNLVTLSDLQSGVEFALDRLGLAIQDKS